VSSSKEDGLCVPDKRQRGSESFAVDAQLLVIDCPLTSQALGNGGPKKQKLERTEGILKVKGLDGDAPPERKRVTAHNRSIAWTRHFVDRACRSHSRVKPKVMATPRLSSGVIVQYERDGKRVRQMVHIVDHRGQSHGAMFAVVWCTYESIEADAQRLESCRDLHGLSQP